MADEIGEVDIDDILTVIGEAEDYKDKDKDSSILKTSKIDYMKYYKIILLYFLAFVFMYFSTPLDSYNMLISVLIKSLLLTGTYVLLSDYPVFPIKGID